MASGPSRLLTTARRSIKLILCWLAVRLGTRNSPFESGNELRWLFPKTKNRVDKSK